MGFRRGMIAALGFILTVPAVWAFGADKPATRPTHVEVQGDALAEEVMSVLDVDGLPLRDFVTYLADQWKDVQIVQFTGPWQDLVVPRLHLRNVTRKQVLELLGNMFPDLYIHSLDQDYQDPKGGQFSGNVWIFQQVQHSGAPVRTRVAAFGLTQTVDRLVFHRMAVAAISEGAKGEKSGQIQGPDKDAEQQALKDVLSLIQATLDQSAEPDITPTVMLHEPTETVLIKGTPLQISAVEQALQALGNSMSDKSLEGKLLQAISENNVLREQLRVSQLREAKPQEKPGSNQ